MNRIKITHFSDVLCVWAYLSQIRIDELLAEFNEQIDMECRLFPVFGDAGQKIADNWAAKGGRAAYNQHVRDTAARFDHVSIHPEIWLKEVPHSSLPAHLYLCAIRLLEAERLLERGSYFRLAWHIRKAFFTELVDISCGAALDELVEAEGLRPSLIQGKIRSGEAFAVMAGDMQMAREMTIRSSPTLIFNEDRQRLTGNVGYRIIEANVRELLEKSGVGQSWC